MSMEYSAVLSLVRGETHGKDRAGGDEACKALLEVLRGNQIMAGLVRGVVTHHVRDKLSDLRSLEAVSQAASLIHIE